MADSANLYLTVQQGELYEVAIGEAAYVQNVLLPLADAESALPALWRRVHSVPERPVVLVDCGPATVRESVRHINIVNSISPLLRYVAIDVNERLIEKVYDGVREQVDVDVFSVNGLFERMRRSVLPLPKGDDFDILFMFGSTAMNMEISVLSSMLSTLASEGDFVALQVIISDSGVAANRSPLLGYVSREVLDFTFEPLRLVGANFVDFQPDFCWDSCRIEFRFKVTRRVRLRHPELPSLGVGDVVLTGFSRRPARQRHEFDLCRLFRSHETQISECMVATSTGRL